MLDCLYPPKCPICDEILAQKSSLICPACRRALPVVREPLCRTCGRPLPSAEQEQCGECALRVHAYLQGRSVFVYEGQLRDALMRMKFQNRREYLDFFAMAMVQYAQGWLGRICPEALVPVPMHPKKKKERGFDQCAILAKKVSGLSGIPVREDLVRRIRYTLPQKGLDLKSRYENMKDAFEVPAGVLVPETVVLIDDIYTTGSTVDALAEVFRRNGAHAVYVFTVSIVKGPDDP